MTDTKDEIELEQKVYAGGLAMIETFGDELIFRVRSNTDDPETEVTIYNDRFGHPSVTVADYPHSDKFYEITLTADINDVEALRDLAEAANYAADYLEGYPNLEEP